MGAAASCGLGTDNVVQIEVDNLGKMRVDKLEAAILATKAKGHVPFFVNCTCGTTVVGAFDPINPIADLCQKYGMWLHIDVSPASSSNMLQLIVETAISDRRGLARARLSICLTFL